MRKIIAFKNSNQSFAAGVPALLWQAIFFYAPLTLLLFSSLIKFSAQNEFEGFTFEKITFFFNATYLKVLLSSLILAITNSTLCLGIGFPVAYCLAFKMDRYKNLFLFLLMVPFWTNFLLHVYAWFYVLDKQGILNSLLVKLGIVDNPTTFLNSPLAILIMMVYYYLPFLILPLYSSLERFDKKLMEASLDLGASHFTTFRKIVLPLCKNGLKAGFFLVFIPSFGEFAIPELMGGDKIMFAGSVMSHFILGDETGSLGAAFALISCLILFAVSLILYKIFDLILSPRTTHDPIR